MSKTRGLKQQVSVELLFHFQCGRCQGWWSIADGHLLNNTKVFSCPTCGASQLFDVKGALDKALSKTTIVPTNR